MTEAELVKVVFRLEPDDDGWPPTSNEGVWAEPLGNGRYRLDNTPWFVTGVAADDIVAARPEGDGTLWVDGVVQWGGHLTIRVIPLDDGPFSGDLQSVIDVFARLGASGEGALPHFTIVAFDIPPGADIRRIKRRLIDGVIDGSWDYDEGCISDRWRETE